MGSGKKRKRQNTTRSDDGNGNESRQRQSKKDKTTTTTTTNLHDTGNSHSSSRNQKERRQEQVDAKKHVGTKETKSKLLSSTSSSFIFNKYDYNQQSNNNNNHNISKKSFYTPQDGSEYNELIQNHYQGFVHIPAKNVTPTSFHQFARKTLEKLRDSNYYQYDVVMAGGKHSSRTFVKRTLVGDPGITYKYLGLRLFAHAWSNPSGKTSRDNDGVAVVPSVMKDIGTINKHMIEMTKSYENHGLCNYNLTLINYMEPTSHNKVGFKDEANYGMGKVSVSWHADSSVESNSSIAVYHCLPTQRSSKWDWRIALRPAPSTEKSSSSSSKTKATTNKTANKSNKTIPPIVIPTEDNDAYLLLGKFNELYQHCVLAGSETSRISTTHRVAVTKQDTYQYILRKVKGAISGFQSQLNSFHNNKIKQQRHEQQQQKDVDDDDQQKNKTKKKKSSTSSASSSLLDTKTIVLCQRIHTEVEMEWIAQYWLQGTEHDKLHTYWQRPMRTLERLWCTLEELTYQLYQICISSNEKGGNNMVGKKVILAFCKELISRQVQRKSWDERRNDKIYQRRINPEFRPVARPNFDIDTTITGMNGKGKGREKQRRLDKDLTKPIADLSNILLNEFGITIDEDSSFKGEVIVSTTTTTTKKRNEKKRKSRENIKQRTG